MQTTKALSLAVLFSAAILSTACSKREEAPVAPPPAAPEATPAPAPVPPPPLPEASTPMPGASSPGLPVDPASAPASGSAS